MDLTQADKDSKDSVSRCSLVSTTARQGDGYDNHSVPRDAHSSIPSTELSTRSRPIPPILCLPDEILQTIFAFTPDPSIFSITLVCRRFYHLSTLPISWRARCAQYTFWEPHHSYQQKLRHPNPSEVQWKKLFVKRYKSNKRVAELLDGIIKYSTDRISRFENIAKDGYDAKDCLRRELDCDEDREDVLARRYFASEALAFIHRKRAIEIWKRVSEDLDVPLEEALGAYDLFVTRGANRDVEAISRSLDSLAAQFREQNPHFSDLSSRELASCLISFMRRVGFTGASYEEYYNLGNSFIGICVDSTRATLPVTTVVVFCALAGRLGLDAKPCGFPHHVIAIVTYSEPDHNDPNKIHHRQSYWDPFKTHLEITPSEIKSQLRAMGVHTTSLFLSPSNTKELIVRVARNILESVRHTGPQPVATFGGGAGSWDRPPFVPERHSALYAALTASVICGPPASTRLLEHMCTLMQRDFGMDVGFFENDMAQLTSEDDALLLHNICNAVRKEDATPKKPMLRYPRTTDTVAEGSNTATATAAPANTFELESEHAGEDLLGPLPSSSPVGDSVRYHIGTIFRHRRYGYEAVITGWTRNCATDENWIWSMDVDKLKRGRHQPFYNVFVADGSSRYVAEDNILEIKPGSCGHDLGGFLVMGKWFRRFEKAEGRFVSNLEDEYPDG